MDIALTATLRPEIIERTLASFCERLLGSGGPHRLIANIDPVGEPLVTPYDVCRVLHRHFGENLVVRVPPSPSFPGAVRWCWEQVQSEFFLNLEDDWELLVELDLEQMLRVLQENPSLALLRFPKGATGERFCQQSGSLKEPKYRWNGSYWACPKDLRRRNTYYGSPSVIRTAWAKAIAPRIDPLYSSPEKQIQMLRRKAVSCAWDWEYGVFSKPNTHRVIEDIGTTWRRNLGIRKNNYQNFTHWET